LGQRFLIDPVEKTKTIMYAGVPFRHKNVQEFPASTYYGCCEKSLKETSSCVQGNVNTLLQQFAFRTTSS
jgi:hypothetical protein